LLQTPSLSSPIGEFNGSGLLYGSQHPGKHIAQRGWRQRMQSGSHLLVSASCYSPRNCHLFVLG
ncbi:unnamed protein product, partial [Bubo scandiacus]